MKLKLNTLQILTLNLNTSVTSRFEHPKQNLKVSLIQNKKSGSKLNHCILKMILIRVYDP